jgi:tetratricopeptide (TPR) repeat protein
MKVFSTFMLLMLGITTGFSCIWITGTKYNTSSITTGGIYPANRLERSLKLDLHSDGVKMESDLRDSTNFDDRCDYAVAKIYLGQYNEAIELLKRLESEKPGQYAVAANLGTVYELSGNNVDALKWIKEAINRNRDSHMGTEWLHAKILEEKIAAGKEQDYFMHHTVLDLSAEAIQGNIVVDGQSHSAEDVDKALEYQLEERMQFVKPKEPVVAGLLFDYASVEAATRTLESAEKLLDLSAEYGFPMEKIQPLIKIYDQKITWRKTKQGLMYSSIGLFAVGLLAYLYKRGIFVLSSKDLKKIRLTFLSVF